MQEAVRKSYKNQFEKIRIIMSLTLRNVVKTKRTLFLVLMASIPALFVILLLFMKAAGTAKQPGIHFFTVIMASLMVRGIMLILTVFYGSTVFTDEVDRKTLVYLKSKPISPFSLIFGKYLSAFILVSIILVISTIATYIPLTLIDGGNAIFRYIDILLRDLLTMILGSASYISFMVFISMFLKKPALWGLVFTLGWENVVVNIPGPISKLTLLHWVQSIFPHTTVTNKVLSVLHPDPSPISTSIFVLLIVTAVFLALSVMIYKSREYKLN